MARSIEGNVKNSIKNRVESYDIPIRETEEGTEILKKIDELKGTKRRFFMSSLMDVAHDHEWCDIHNINYTSPNFQDVSIELYKELYMGHLY